MIDGFLAILLPVRLGGHLSGIVCQICKRGNVPPAILQSDIFHILTSQYGYRTMSYFDLKQFYRNIVHHYFLQWSWGQKTHQYRNICLQLGWYFALPKMAERISCSKNMGDCQNWKKHLRHIWRLPPRELCQARGSFMGWLFHSTAIPELCRLIMRAAPQNKEPLISHVWVYYAFSYFSQKSGWWVMRV